MGVVIKNVSLSKNQVETGEQFKISVSIKETTSEPIMYRLPIRLGQEKGGIK